MNSQVNTIFEFEDCESNRQPRFGSAVDTEEVVVIIPLTQDQHTIISPIDLNKIDNVNWQASKTRAKYKSIFRARRKESRTLAKGNPRKMHYMHRVILKNPEHGVVDHINGNPLDNRRCNLRVVTSRVNAQNRHDPRTSKYPGVSWDKKTGKWKAYVYENKKQRHLGFFNSEKRAFAEVEKASLEELV